MKTYFNNIQFFSGAVRSRDCIHLLGTVDSSASDDPPKSRIYTFRSGQWEAVELPWQARAMAFCQEPLPYLVAMGSGGLIHVVNDEATASEKPIFTVTGKTPYRGSLRDIRYIPSGCFMAVGSDRQAYRREGPSTWICVDQTLPKGSEGDEKCLESVDGFNEGEIYAVGSGGDIWRFDGRIWHALPRVTHTHLHRVICAADGQVYACGHCGTLVMGRRDQWQVIAQGDTSEALWGLAFCKNVLYVSSASFLYRLDAGRLVRVAFDDEIPSTCQFLAAGDDVLLLVGKEDVVYLDGTVWRRLI